MQKERKDIISPFALFSVSAFIVTGIIYVASDISPRIADLINGSLSQGFRRIMASFSDAFSFSLFETLVIILPLILSFVVYKAVKRFADRRGRIGFVVNFVAFILLIYSGHIFALGIAHNTTHLSETMDLPTTQVSEENLSETLIDLRNEINYLVDLVPRNENGVFDPQYSYDEISEKICKSYENLSDLYGLPYGFESRAKGVKSGAAMSYLGITGIYTYVTGEANVNTAYPAYVTLFTTAHEMSHQRGIMRENEANFIAYLITSTSDDPCLRYSGALNMYNYFASALYKTNRDAYLSIASELRESAKVDFRASNEVSKKYGDTIFEDISDWINDHYLESSGSEGIISYSRVVELVLAYREVER